jgi:uncharacterized membrane protein YgcG
MRRFFIAGVLAVALATSMQAQERTHILDPKLDSLFPDQPTSYLTDVTGKVTNPDIVNARLRDIREKDSLSLVAVVLPTTGDRAVEDVAREIGRKWLVAQKAEIGNVERNTGGVILLVLDSHKCRVEVATGSEGYMTDGRAADACRNARDNFRAGAFGDGIISIANEFDAAHKGETAVAAAVKPTEPATPDEPWPWGWILGIGSAILAILAIGSAIGLKDSADNAKREEEERIAQAARDAEYRRQAAENEARRLQQEREAAAREAARWNALTPEQQAARNRCQAVKRHVLQQSRRRRKRSGAASVKLRKRRNVAIDARLIVRRLTTGLARLARRMQGRSSSWSSGGSDSFSGGGGGSDW